MTWATNGPILVMGVSGCGKTSVGLALARALGGTFLDGDDYHLPENIARMGVGQPLTDAMRWPWLDALKTGVAGATPPVVFACSALRRGYRDHLRAGLPTLRTVFLDAPQSLIADRLAARRGHFMPPGLLASQFATLEMPRPDEGVITVSAAPPVDAIVSTILAHL